MASTPAALQPPKPARDHRASLAGLGDLWARRPAWAHNRQVMALLASLVALLLLFLVALTYIGPDRPGREIGLNEVTRLAQDKQIATLELRDLDAVAVGTLRGGGGEFSAEYPASDAVTADLLRLAQSNGAEVDVDGQGTKAAVRTATTFLLPLMILANLFALLFLAGRAGSGGMSDVETFGTLRGGRKGAEATSRVTFADVAGADEAVEELQEVVDYLRDPNRYASVGAVPPKGVLLFGPPGCGKTLIARAVAGEAGVPFFSVGGAEFVESLVGVGAARVRDLFQKVRDAAPAIVFIDELDAAARRRGGSGSGGGGSDEREQTLNQMLVEIDGFDVASGLVVIGATNRPDILDPAILRPGRFDRHVTVDQPDHGGRLRILKLHAGSKPMGSGVDLDGVARRTPGFTGADLANVINEAALLTVRGGRQTIETDVLEEAVQRVLHGPQRRGRVLTPAERHRAAVHEAGHAVTATALGKGDDVHRVSILARGRGVGLTSVQDSDAVLFTHRDLENRMIVALSGIAAEEIALGESSTGAEQDVEHATHIARELVGRYGMSERLGRVRLLAADTDEYLGTGTGLAAISERTHEAFDEEVRRLLDEAETHARAIVEDNQMVLAGLVDLLLERETLEGAHLTETLAGVRAAA